MDTAMVPWAFDRERMPTLLYITKQRFGGRKRDRPLHSHDDLCELLLVYRGFGSYTIRGRDWPIQEGDVLYTNRDELHEVRSASDAEIGTYCFGYTDVRFEGLPRDHMISGGELPVRASGEQFPFFRELCERAYQSLDRGREGRRLAQALGTALLLTARELDGEALRPHSTGGSGEMAERIRLYLDEHFTDPVTLEGVAAFFGCSGSYVSHVFKRETGWTPIQYVIRRRIGLAQTLLITTDYAVGHVASLVGYDNANYFDTVFTKVVGVSPTRYKRRYMAEMRGRARP